MVRRWLWLLVVAVLALSVGAWSGRSSGPPPLTIAGSTSMLPLLEPLADAFTKASGIPVRLNLVGSTAGLVALRAGAADLAAVSRGLDPGEGSWAVAEAVAQDGLAVVVHPRRAGLVLTPAQLRDVLSGKVARWEALASQTPGPLRLVLREEGSGTRDALQELLAPPTVRLDALVQGSSGAVLATVAADPDALGIISTYALDERVRAVPIRGALPTPEAIAWGRYPLVRPLYLCRRDGPQAPAADRFLAFAHSRAGRRVIAAAGFVPVPPPNQRR